MMPLGDPRAYAFHGGCVMPPPHPVDWVTYLQSGIVMRETAASRRNAIEAVRGLEPARRIARTVPWRMAGWDGAA